MQIEPDIQSNLNFSIEKGCHQNKILGILRDNLSGFSEEFKSNEKSEPDIDINLEDYISKQLSLFLNNKVNQTGYLFQFQAIGPDIFVLQFEARVHSQALFLIEAKRLPCTSSQDDYVKTGIGRFRKEKHGKGHSTAAMLGYVQEKSFDHWFTKVNSWIVALVSNKKENPKWTQKERINEIQISDIGEYRSKHCRINEKPITLHHFWINLCN